MSTLLGRRKEETSVAGGDDHNNKRTKSSDDQNAVSDNDHKSDTDGASMDGSSDCDKLTRMSNAIRTVLEVIFWKCLLMVAMLLVSFLCLISFIDWILCVCDSLQITIVHG